MGRIMLLVYAGTLFCSATLLFVVEPMVGKMILPRLGGSPAVWNTCMVFFQAILLAGYSYAHATTASLGVRKQALLHLALLALGFALLLLWPLTLHAQLIGADSDHPIPGLLACLVVSFGVPLFLVCTSAPLLQKWFAGTEHPSAADPYFLYGASNLGSMLALLAYPSVVEPFLTLQQQRWLWVVGYGVLMALTAGCAWFLWRFGKPAQMESLLRAETGETSGEGVSAARRLRWVALAFVPSSLMLGATTYITTDVAAIAMLWVIPLALYLLSFILVFSRLPALVHRIFVLLLPPLLLVLLVNMIGGLDLLSLLGSLMGVELGGMAETIGFHLLLLFVVSMVCHGELARDRPSTKYLTGYFLWISIGGVLGGLFNSLLAPVLFNSLAEYPLVLVVACLLLPEQTLLPALGRTARQVVYVVALLVGVTAVAVKLRYLPQTQTGAHHRLGDRSWAWEGVSLALLVGVGLAGVLRSRRSGRAGWLDLLQPACLGVLTLVLAWGVDVQRTGDWLLAWLFGAPALICYALVERPLRFGLGVGFFALGAAIAANAVDDSLYQRRSFFGVVIVGDNARPARGPMSYRDVFSTQNEKSTLTVAAGESLPYRNLFHGSTLHGRQFLRDDLRDVPLTYYHDGGPVGQLLTRCNTDPRRSLGVIGLGAGTLASYALPGQKVTFYDIDPLVRDIAYTPQTAYFSFVADARKRGALVDLVLGDARVQMTQQTLAEPDRYGILVIDAFSSDAIPIHLITREAIQVYLDHLREDGILAFHITNKHVFLDPVLANLAADLGLTALLQNGGSDDRLCTKRSRWMILARRREYLRRMEGPAWKTPEPRPELGVWTDDYSNVLGVFRW